MMERDDIDHVAFLMESIVYVSFYFSKLILGPFFVRSVSVGLQNDDKVFFLILNL